MTKQIPLFNIYWDNDDINSVTNTIKRGNRWAQGPEIQEFENLITEYLNIDHCLVFNSGTSALHASILGCGIGQGDQVIVPSFTFIATTNTPLFVGATPVFGDIEERSFGLDPIDIEKRINEKTKAILPIHYSGGSALIKELSDIAEDHNIILIEDVAESLGAAYNNKKVGTFGKASILSFCQNKIITTGEGGAVVTNDKELYEKLKLIRSHGRLEEKDYFSSSDYMDYITLGYNFRMSAMTASLGISQFKKIDKIIEMRQGNAEYMNKSLSEIPQLNVPLPLENSTHVYQMYTIRITAGEKIRNKFKDYLVKNGISCKVYFDPVHLTKFFRDKFNCKEGDLPITEKVSKEVLSLPMFPHLKKDDMDYIIDKVKEFFKSMVR